jgi:hypothetical protein
VSLVFLLVGLVLSVDVVHPADAHSSTPHRTVELAGGVAATIHAGVGPAAPPPLGPASVEARPLSGVDLAPPDHPPRPGLLAVTIC